MSVVYLLVAGNSMLFHPEVLNVVSSRIIVIPSRVFVSSFFLSYFCYLCVWQLSSHYTTNLGKNAKLNLKNSMKIPFSKLLVA